MRAAVLLSGIIVTLLASGCGGQPQPPDILVPPRLDVRHFGRVGLVTFTVENAKGTLHQYATTRFAEGVLAAQPGVEVLEVGAMDTLQQRLGESEFGIESAQALGKAHNVPAVFVGHLKVSNPTMSGGLNGLAPHLESTVRMDLAVQLLSTADGGTLWRSSAWASEQVGEISLGGGELEFGAKDPEKAYGHIVGRLVRLVTQDMYATWERPQ